MTIEYHVDEVFTSITSIFVNGTLYYYSIFDTDFYSSYVNINTSRINSKTTHVWEAFSYPPPTEGARGKTSNPTKCYSLIIYRVLIIQKNKSLIANFLGLRTCLNKIYIFSNKFCHFLWLVEQWENNYWRNISHVFYKYLCICRQI